MPALLRARTADPAYDFTHADRDGRLVVRTAAAALGWPSDTTLSATHRDTTVVLSRGGGQIKLRKDGYLRLPIALRRRAGLTSGIGVLLAADLAHDELVICPPAALDAMIAKWHAAETGGGQ